MSLVRLVYASRATDTFQPSSIKSILSSARRNNRRNGLSGLLCFNQHCFLQCLEGPRSLVNQTYQRILRDPRHTDAEIISYEYVNDNEFDSWNMGYLQDGPGMRDLIQQHSGQEIFAPLNMSPKAALELLKSIRDHIESMIEEEQ